MFQTHPNACYYLYFVVSPLHKSSATWRMTTSNFSIVFSFLSFCQRQWIHRLWLVNVSCSFNYLCYRRRESNLLSRHLSLTSAKIRQKRVQIYKNEMKQRTLCRIKCAFAILLVQNVRCATQFASQSCYVLQIG